MAAAMRQKRESQDADVPGAMPTPTPVQSQPGSPPAAAAPQGQLPTPTPVTNPTLQNAAGNIEPGNRLVPGDTGRQVGTLRDYAVAAGAKK